MAGGSSQGSGSAGSIIATLSLILPLIRLAMAATSYTVGDATGWTTNTDLNAWAAHKAFRVGDTLVFKYDPGLHSVLQVSEAAFSSCSLTASLASYQTGLDSIVLSEVKSYYFVCGTPGDCVGGMAMEISVSAEGSPSQSLSPAPHVSPALSPTTHSSPSPSASPSSSPSLAPAPAPSTPSSSPNAPSPTIIPSESPEVLPSQAPGPAKYTSSASTLHISSAILSSALLAALSLLF